MRAHPTLPERSLAKDVPVPLRKQTGPEARFPPTGNNQQARILPFWLHFCDSTAMRLLIVSLLVVMRASCRKVTIIVKHIPKNTPPGAVLFVTGNFNYGVWQDVEGKTMLCFAGELGEQARQMLEPNSKLIHTFYASSHYEAMTIYYQFMDWGEYTTEFEVDKQLYKK